jgi:hypothetical protein
VHIDSEISEGGSGVDAVFIALYDSPDYRVAEKPFAWIAYTRRL